jgi:SNF2 family DNA or RNA helicase
MTLHAFWLPDSYVMAFWLEDESCPADDLDHGSVGHPRGMSHRELASRLPDELELYEERRTGLFPAENGLPIASTDDIPIAATLKPWRIETGETIAECVIEFFLTRPLPVYHKPRVGTSLTYWQELAEFAEQLVEGTAFVPGVVQLEGKSYPGWQAAIPDDLKAYWQYLVASMPPIVHALTSDTEFAAEALPLSFLDACVDFQVRQWSIQRNPKFHSPRKNQPPLPKQWLDALEAGHFKAMNADNRRLDTFIEEVGLWNDRLRPVSPYSPFRLGLDLVPPDDQDGTWEILCSVRSARDRDLSVPADELFDPTESGTHSVELVGCLLTGLGRAAADFPALAQSLESVPPKPCCLDRSQALVFMTEAAPLLQKRGFIVRLPTWWEEPQEQLGLLLRISTSANTGTDRRAVLGLDQMIGYDWEVAIGDEPLSEAEFRELASSKSQLIHRHGGWFRIDAEAVNRSMKSLEKKGFSGRESLAKAMEMGFSLERAGGLPVLDLRFEGGADASWIDDFRGDQKFAKLPTPEPFVGTLRPYQEIGFSWMHFVTQIGFGACLADDMGLGKTVQMIAVLAYQKSMKQLHGPSLIICPMSVVGNWAREMERFAPSLKVLVHHGGDRSGQRAFVESVEAYDAVITTYNLIVRDQTSFLSFKWHNIVLDEAQNIKNPSTKQTVAIRSLRGNYRYCLTGTPVENRLAELWSIMDFLNPGFLGKLSTFRTHFAMPIERDGSDARAAILRKITLPFILRRLKSDRRVIRDLPEKQEMKVFCNLTAEQAGLYQSVVDEMFSRLSAGEESIFERKGLILSALVKLKQITNHPANFLHDESEFGSSRSGKLQRLEEMLQVILDEGDKALIFTQFAQLGHLLQPKLTRHFGVNVLYLHGGTTQRQREQLIDQFQTKKGPPIFVLSLKAGGLGLNLTEANHVFHFDRWWNPAVEDQATDRAFRIGQLKNVQVHKFICVGTVEEKIDRMIDDKKRLADNIINAGEKLITDLSFEQLRDAFVLSRDAVSEQ